MIKRLTFNSQFCTLALVFKICLASALLSPTLSPASVDAQLTDIRTLNDKGIYWYERFRFDLAVQSFNKILLLDPINPQALRWQGLIDLARGDIQAAHVWLEKLQHVHSNHPLAIELEQLITLTGEKRQELAELRDLANSGKPPVDLPLRLRQLLPQAPLGEAAMQIYRLMNRTPEGREHARIQVTQLAQLFPEDKRYKTLLTELGGTTQAKSTPPPSIVAKKPVRRESTAVTGLPQTTLLATAKPTPTEPIQTISNFEQGQQFNEQAQELIKQGDKASAASYLQQAIDLNPTYPWFRYDLATLLDEQSDAGSKRSAKQLMEEGMAQDPSVEMRFASALLAARQNRGNNALDLINTVPRENWTDGMNALERRVQYNQHLETLRELQRRNQFDQLASALSSTPQWRTEPEVQSIEKNLHNRGQVRLRVAYENATIHGDEGVSKVDSREIPLQIDLPLGFEKTLFLRADTLSANAGRINPSTGSNFAKLGTTQPNDPSISNTRLDQNYQGHVIGIGLETEQYRVDLGTTAGNYPVNNWVGGMQWRTNLGEGTLRLELARRMVTGSVLSTMGAIDPLTGETWGGARRNGLSMVYYQAQSPTLDLIGIARANRITGKNIPNNTEVSLQGIVGKTIYQQPGHEVEIGASLLLWSFQKNLRLHTFGQGGYYSPQAFGSLSLPVTWTANMNGWSWQLQGRVGTSESREDSTLLYPLNPELAAAAIAQNNPTLQLAKNGGGTHIGLRFAVERRLLKNLVMGGYFELDRSEGYNPDRLQLYLKNSFGQLFDLSTPPEGLVPYSRF